MKKTGFLALVSSVTVAAGTVGIGLPQITNAETTTKLTNVDTVLIYNPLMYESGVTKSTGNIVGQGSDAYETINGLYVPADNDENAGSAQNAASSGIEYFDHSKDEFQDLTEYYNSKAKESNKSNSSNEVISQKNVLPAVGSTKDFHILQDMNNESAYDNAVQFKCMAVGSKGIVWTYDSPNITTEFAQEILKEFDDNIYASDNKHFGNARFDDPENNQLVNILVYPMTQSNLGGFAYSKDCYSTDEANYYSNLDPSKMNTDQCIMHTNYNVWTRSGGKQTVYGVIAHEFQHLISYAYILGNKNATRFIPAYFTEGTAMEAEELYKSGLVRNQSYINFFNKSDEIIKGKSIYNFRSNVSSYGASYLYTDYITRLSDPTASDVTMWKTFLTNWREAKTKTDLNIGNILKKTLPADKVSQIDSVIEYPDSIKQDINTSADNSEVCKNEDEWLSKLTLAHYISLVLKEEQGSIYGIASNISEDVGPYTCPANASNTSANIEGGGRIYVRTADSSTFTIPKDADPGLIYVGFKDHKMTVAPTTADEYDKTYTVNYEWTNAPVTEEIPGSGKTYNGYTNASKNKDTKYTSSYETVVDDKVYRFSGWTENVNDTTITYTGTWTATDIIDFSKAGIQVYPASTTYTGYPIVPTITVSYNGNVVDSSEYTVTFLDYKGETVPSDKLIHAGDYTIVISPKAGEKYNRGIGRAYYVINKKTSTRAPRFASYEKGSFSPDNNGSFTYNAPVKSGCEYKLDNGTWQDSNTFYNIKKGSSHTLYVRYKGTSDVTESASTTIAITAPSDTSLIKLENDGFRIVNNLNAGDYYNIETVARKDGFVDISGASQQNNANVDLWSNNGNPCQKFYF
ncbi:MAG: RICIN domain-containing protein, partial [Lachnospiraceae bacterium]|nr:RICIN domain-containing protein [Lachnospiraceae bacterium]